MRQTLGFGVLQQGGRQQRLVVANGMPCQRPKPELGALGYKKTGRIYFFTKFDEYVKFLLMWPSQGNLWGSGCREFRHPLPDAGNQRLATIRSEAGGNQTSNSAFPLRPRPRFSRYHLRFIIPSIDGPKPVL